MQTAKTADDVRLGFEEGAHGGRGWKLEGAEGGNA
jgi:hypothetical protein